VVVGESMKKYILLIFVVLLSACSSMPEKRAGDFVFSSLTSIDGEELMPQGRFPSPTLLLVFDHTCSHCNEAMARLNDWVIPELEDYDVDVVAIGRGHGAEDIKRWREEEGLNFKLVEDPDKALSSQLEYPGVPAFKFVDRSGNVLFQYAGWSSNVGRTLMSDIKFILNNKSTVDKNSLINNVLELSSTDENIQSMGRSFAVGLGTNKDKMPAGMYEEILAISDESLDVDEMKSINPASK